MSINITTKQIWTALSKIVQQTTEGNLGDNLGCSLGAGQPVGQPGGRATCGAAWVRVSMGGSLKGHIDVKIKIQ